jgi:hypothetical protein
MLLARPVTESLSEKGSDPLKTRHWVLCIAREGQTPFRIGSENPKSTQQLASVQADSLAF